MNPSIAEDENHLNCHLNTPVLASVRTCRTISRDHAQRETTISGTSRIGKSTLNLPTNRFCLLGLLILLVSSAGCKKQSKPNPQAPLPSANTVETDESDTSPTPATAPPSTDATSESIEAVSSAPYRVIELAVPDSTGLAPSAIGENGSVVGQASYADGRTVAVVWRDGEVEQLPTPGELRSGATAVAGNGRVAGWIETAPRVRNAVTWQDGQFREIEGANIRMTEATGVNDDGVVCGWSRDGNGSNQIQSAVLWSEQEGLTAYALGHAFLTDVNNRGQMVGTMATMDDRGHTYAFISDDGMTTTDLGSLEGYASHAEAMNDRGTVIGWSMVNRLKHGFIWRDGEMVDLGTCERSDSVYAMGVNNDDLVVGVCFNMRGFYDGGNPRLMRAYVWDQGVMTPLNDLIEADTGWELIRATDINDKGMIVGNGMLNGESTGFLLIPNSD